jgi:hypothetical protein
MEAMFSKLSASTKNTHIKKFIQIQMNKASNVPSEKEKMICYRNAAALFQVIEQADKLHVLFIALHLYI